MSTETQKVDVLAIMEKAARELWVHGEPVNPVAADMLVARAAVAELIEAAKAAHPFVGWESAGTTALRERLYAALARVGGAS